MTNLAELNSSELIGNPSQTQAFAPLQGIALDCLDSYTLDFIKKVFPSTTSGLEFTALLLQQAEPREMLPAEIAGLIPRISMWLFSRRLLCYTNIATMGKLTGSFHSLGTLPHQV